MTNKERLICSSALVLFVWCFVLSPDAVALTPEDNVTQGFMDVFRARITGISDNITSFMTYTFWTLITIEFVYAMGLAAMQDKGIQGIFSEFMQRLFYVGFWIFVFEQGWRIPKLLIDGFYKMGTQAAGISSNAFLKPDHILELGLKTMAKVADNFSSWNLGESIAMLVAASCVFFCFLIIAANMVLLLMELWIVAYTGVAFLALGATRWTSGFAVSYLKYIITVGAKIMVFMIIVGIAYNIVAKDILAVEETNSRQMWAAAAIAFVMCILATKAPNSMAGALNGSSFNAGITTAQVLNAGKAATAAGLSAGAAAMGAGALAAASGSEGARSASAVFDNLTQSGGSKLSGAAKAIGAGLAGSASAAGGAAKGEFMGRLSGQRDDGSLYPTGGTTTGRMAANVKANKQRG